jgi:hypothetical protein
MVIKVFKMLYKYTHWVSSKVMIYSDVDMFSLLSLMYWIYLLPSTQQTIGCNGFTTTCFDSHESSSGYVQNLLVWAVLLLKVLEVVGRYEAVAVLTLIWTKFWKHISRNVTGNRLIFQYRVSSTYDTRLVHSLLLLIIYACGTCSNVARHNIPEVYALFTRTLTFSNLLVTGCTNKLNTLKILRSAYIVFLCFVFIWEQTANCPI